MKAMERRIKNIEDSLCVGRPQKKLFIVIRMHDVDPLPEPIKEWITYKEAEANCGEFTIFVTDRTKELEARKSLRNATEGQRNEQCKTTA